MHHCHNMEAEEENAAYAKATGAIRPEDAPANSSFRVEHEAAMRGEGPVVDPQLHAQIMNLQNAYEAKVEQANANAEPVY